MPMRGHEEPMVRAMREAAETAWGRDPERDRLRGEDVTGHTGDTDESDYWNGEQYDGVRGLERDYDNLPAGYDRDNQASTGPHEYWAGPFFGEHMLGPHARRPHGVPPRGYRHTDARLYEQVNERLGASVQLDARDIEVQVEAGEVTLTGTVADRREKRIAEFIAMSVPGVDDVHNRLRIRSGGGVGPQGSVL